MKRNDWKIIIGSIAFTYLFYQQGAGINFLIFAIIASLFLFLNNTENILKPSVIVSFLGTILSAVFVYIYGTSLPIISFVISISLLSAFIFEPSSSLILAGFQGFINVALSIPKIIMDVINREPSETAKKNNFTKVFLLFIPLVITLIFFFLYRIANPNFLEFTKALNFDWISLPLLRFLFLAFLLSYGLFTKKVLSYLLEKDLKRTDELKSTTEESHQTGAIGKRLSIEYEIFIGASLLIMLNILLAIVNGIDLVKLWPNPVLPENQESFSEYLHGGVQMLILSIIFAVAILMFFFRGYFNYFKGAKYLRILGFIWIIQNVVLLLSTALRNNMYVEAYGLSHKRIGVFIYLLLAIIGLVITFYKLFAKKNNTFLFRKNAWAFYFVLLIATPIAWDQIITNHNINLAQKQNKAVDYEYLARLSHVNLGQIIPQLKLNQQDMFMGTAMSYDTNYHLNRKLVQFLDESNHEDWQSSCLSRKQNLQIIEQLNKEGKLPAIVLNEGNTSLKTIRRLTNLKSLQVDSYNDILDWSKLSDFPQLELLNTRNAYSNVLDSLPPLPKLKYLNMEYNYITNISKLSNYTSLEYLNIKSNDFKSYKPLFALVNLKELHVDDLGEEAKAELEAALPNTEIIYFDNAYRSY